MAFKREEKAQRPPRVYCGQCENGFVIVETGDPMYPKAAKCCPRCNSELGRQLYEEHLQKMGTDSNYRAAEKQSQERIKAEKVRLLNPELQSEAEEVFPRLPYVPPSQRKAGETLKAQKELALLLYPDKTQDLDFWDFFNEKHPDPVADLEKAKAGSTITASNGKQPEDNPEETGPAAEVSGSGELGS